MEPNHTPSPHDPPASGASSREPGGALDVRRRRILFRATHRGTHETDILVGGFVRAGLAGFSDPELDLLEELMELPDIDLADWLTGRRPIPPDCDTPMLRRMAAAARDAAASARLGKA